MLSLTLVAVVVVICFFSSSTLDILAEVADREWSNERFLAFLFWREVLAIEPVISFTGPTCTSHCKDCVYVCMYVCVLTLRPPQVIILI